MKLIICSVILFLSIACERAKVDIKNDSIKDPEAQNLIYSFSESDLNMLSDNITQNNTATSSKRLFVQSSVIESLESIKQSTKISLIHEFKTNDYLDFGYSVEVNEFKLNRFRSTSGNSTFITFDFVEDTIVEPAALSTSKLFEYIAFYATDSKQIKETNLYIQTSQHPGIVNIKHGERVKLNEDLFLKFNKNFKPNTTIIGLSYLGEDNITLSIRFSANASSLIIPKKHLEEFDQRIKHDNYTFYLWIIEDQTVPEPITTTLKSGEILATPIVRQSFHAVSVKNY